MFRPYRVRSLQGQFPQHMWLSTTNWPSCSPGRLAHPGLINFLKHSSGPGPSLPRNFQWLFIGRRVKSLLLNLGIESLLESDPKAGLSLSGPCRHRVHLQGGLLPVPGTAPLAFCSECREGLPSSTAHTSGLSMHPASFNNLVPTPWAQEAFLPLSSSRLLMKAAQSRDSCSIGLLQHEFMRGAA